MWRICLPLTRAEVWQRIHVSGKKPCRNQYQLACVVSSCISVYHGSVWLVIPNLPNSENGRRRREWNAFPNQTQTLQGFMFHPDKTRFPVGKHDYESGAWQQRLMLPITVATQANSPRFQTFANDNENLFKFYRTFYLSEQNVHQAFQTWKICHFLDFQSQSNTNSEFTKSTVFRIGTNQTHP